MADAKFKIGDRVRIKRSDPASVEGLLGTLALIDRQDPEAYFVQIDDVGFWAFEIEHQVFPQVGDLVRISDSEPENVGLQGLLVFIDENAGRGKYWVRFNDATELAVDGVVKLNPDQTGEFIDYYRKQIGWSRLTFGPGHRTKGVIEHIQKELKEIEEKPFDLNEWIDVIILAMDGFWRHGGSAEDLLPYLLVKQMRNMSRTWPDWRDMTEDQAIEHDRSGEQDRKL